MTIETQEALKHTVLCLYVARMARDAAKVELDALPITQVYDTQRAAVADLEAEIRTFAIEFFDGDKNPCPGVTLKMKKVLSYDPDEALNWVVKKGHWKLLRLNAPAFEKVAAITQPDFVTIDQALAVTLSRDFTAAVEEISRIEAQVEAEAEAELQAEQEGWEAQALIEGEAAAKAQDNLQTISFEDAQAMGYDPSHED